MRKLGKFENRKPHVEVRANAKLPKPDSVRTALNAAELHAYYIAVVSSRVLRVTPDLKAK